MDIKDLISECTAYDFKLMLEEKKPKSWLKSVSAFANGDGGSLFFGVDNDGTVQGLDDVQKVTEKISTAIKERMDPLPDVEAIPHKDGDVRVLELKIHSGKYTPYYYVGDGQRVAFVRMGDESVPASAEQMVRLVLKGSNQTYDSLITDNLREKSSFSILASTFNERIGQEFDEKYLKSFGLVTERGLLSNAGVLFSDNIVLPQSRLYCTRWDGVEKGDAINDAEFKGNILMLLREAVNFVKSNTRKGWQKQPNGKKYKTEYAERAVLEVLVNHFIHRDYTVIGGEVHLDIYDDRLTVTSPGGMYNGGLIQEMDIKDVSSERRNPILADVMAQLDYMEKRGSGLKKICLATEELKGYKDKLKPVFKSTNSQFMTTLFRVDEIMQEQVTEHVSEQVTEQDVEQVIKHVSEQVLKMIQIIKFEQLLAKEIMQKMGLSQREHFRSDILNPALDKGLVVRTMPDSLRSPKQKYYLTDLGVAVMNRLNNRCSQPVSVDSEKIQRLITELHETVGNYPLQLPPMSERYTSTLIHQEAKCFQASYKHEKKYFEAGTDWVYMTPDLYLNKIQHDIWTNYNAQWWLIPAVARFKVNFHEIKAAFARLGLDDTFAVITSFHLNTYDDLYGGEAPLVNTVLGYTYKGMNIYHVPSHEDFMIIMKADKLPRCEVKEYEGENPEYKLIDPVNKIYSNILNLKDMGEYYGLAIMRDIRFCTPAKNDFNFIRLDVDRMERSESQLEEIEHIDL